jgi:L-amino acid N-acyltransferase YncA
VRVRTATSADLPEVLEIYNDAVLHTTATYDEEPRTLADRQAWLAEHKADGYPVFVAEDDRGRVIGWSSLSRYRDRRGYRFTTENSVYVGAGWRGQGVGRALMVPLIAGARERAFHVILAGIDATNEASLRLHAAFGFERVAHLHEVGFKFGRWLDVIYLELRL